MLIDGRPAVALVATGSVIRVRFCTSSTSTCTAFFSRAVGRAEVTTTAERRSINDGAGGTCAIGPAQAAMNDGREPDQKTTTGPAHAPSGRTERRYI